MQDLLALEKQCDIVEGAATVEITAKNEIFNILYPRAADSDVLTEIY